MQFRRARRKTSTALAGALASLAFASLSVVGPGYAGAQPITDGSTVSPGSTPANTTPPQPSASSAPTPSITPTPSDRIPESTLVPPTQLSKKPPDRRSDSAHTLVPLPHPISAPSATKLISPNVTGLRFHDKGIVGEYYLKPGESPQFATKDLTQKIQKNYGTQPKITGIIMKSPDRQQAARLQQEAAGIEEAPDDGAVPRLKQPSGGEKGESIPLTKGFAPSISSWAPSRVVSRAYESDRNGVTLNQQYFWNETTNRLSDMPDDWGMELQFGLVNETIDGNHPLCPAGTDDNFWAARGTAFGEVRLWTVAGLTSDDGPGAYFDGNDSADLCSRLGFDIGIGYPKNIVAQPSSLAEIGTLIITDRGTRPSSKFFAEAQAVHNDCNPLPPGSYCMNLPPNETFPGPGENSVLFFNLNRARYVQGGFEYNQGNATYIADCVVTGAFGVRYMQINGGNGPLGRCDSPEYIRYPFDGHDERRVQDFLNGKMYYTTGTGGWEVYGAIGQKYESNNGPKGSLGWPTSGELSTPNGQGRFNRFQTGNIYFGYSVGRAQAVHGAIFVRYGQEGYEGGRFGFPTSDEFPVNGDPLLLQQNFEGGWIRYSFATGQTTTS